LCLYFNKLRAFGHKKCDKLRDLFGGFLLTAYFCASKPTSLPVLRGLKWKGKLSRDSFRFDFCVEKALNNRQIELTRQLKILI